MKKIQSTAAYALVQAMTWAFYAVILSYTSNFLYRFDFRDGQISLVLGIATAVSCVAQLFVAEAVSRSRHLKMYAVILLTCLLMGLGTVAMAATRAVAVLGLGVCCVLSQAIPAMTNALGMDAIERGAPVNYGIARGFGSLGYSALAFLTGLLVEARSAAVIPAVTALCAALLALGTVWFHFTGEKDLAPRQEKAASAESKGFLKANWKFSLFLLGCVLLNISHNMLCNFMLQIISAKGGGATEQGTANAISALVELPVMFLFPLMLRLMGCDKWVRLCVWFFLVKSLGLFFAATPYGVYAAQATQMLGYGLFNISIVDYASRVVKGGDAIRAQSYLAATAPMGSLVAMSSGGYLCQYLGVPAMLLTSAAFAILGALVLTAFTEKTH